MLLITKLKIYGRYCIIIRHGFVSSGLFYLVNLIYNQNNRRLIFVNNGIINFIPSLIIIWFILCLCNVGSPFPLNLIRETVLLISLIFRFKYLFLILIICHSKMINFLFLGVFLWKRFLISLVFTELDVLVFERENWRNVAERTWIFIDS